MLSKVQDDKLCHGLLGELCGPQKYCIRSLRGEPCNGLVCGGLKHVDFGTVGSPDVVAGWMRKATECQVASSRAVSGKEEQALTCPICQDVFVDPVTLTCGHSFDRHCLEAHLATRDECPLCRTAVARPLPSASFVLRDLAAAAYPARVTARSAELGASAKSQPTPVASAPAARLPVAPAAALISAVIAARLWPKLYQLVSAWASSI
jgi:hypothetical protein